MKRFGTTTAVLLAIVVPSGALFLIAFWFTEGHGTDLSRMAQVRLGMTGDQVVAILGHPGTIKNDADGSGVWYYTRGTFCQVKISMSSVGLVSETEHDH